MNGNVVSTGSWILNSTIIYSLISSLAVNVAGENYSFTPIIFNGYFNTTGPAITVQVDTRGDTIAGSFGIQTRSVTIGLIAVVGMYILTKFQVLGHDLAEEILRQPKNVKLRLVHMCLVQQDLSHIILQCQFALLELRCSSFL